MAGRGGIGKVGGPAVNWAAMFAKRRGEPMERRLGDRPQSGRPPKKRQVVVEVLEEVMERDSYCRRTKGVEVSGRTIRRALRGQGYRYKRLRHMPVRCSPTRWQVKGGSGRG